MTIIKDAVIEEPILQNLIPVLTEDGVLHGLIQTGVREWSGSSATLELPNRTLQLKAKSFQGERGTRVLMCSVFPVCLSEGQRPWNGIPGFIDPSLHFSIWATPVMNPGYRRCDIGNLNLFVSNILDPSEKGSEHQTNEITENTDPVVLSAVIGVSASRFEDRFSFVEFNWADLFRKKLEAEGITESCFISVDILQSPPQFKTICYNSTDSSAVPYIMQIMRVSPSAPDMGQYDFVLDIRGKGSYLFKLTLSLR